MNKQGGTKEKYQRTSNLMLDYGLFLFLSMQLIQQPCHPIKLDIFRVFSIIPSLRLRLHLRYHFLICNPGPEIIDGSLLREYIESPEPFCFVEGALLIISFFHIHFFTITTATFAKFIIRKRHGPLAMMQMRKNPTSFLPLLTSEFLRSRINVRLIYSSWHPIVFCLRE